MSLTWRRKLCYENIEVFLAGIKRVELLIAEFRKLSDFLVTNITREIQQHPETPFDLRQKTVLLLETWYNYHIGLFDECFFVKVGIAFRRHMVKNPRNWSQFRHIFHDVDNMQDDYWELIENQERRKLLRGEKQSNHQQPSVKRCADGERKCNNTHWAMHMGTIEMERYMRVEGLLPVEIAEYLNKSFERYDTARAVMMEAIRSVDAALSDMQKRTADHNERFTFLLQVGNADEDPETDMFQFTFGRGCHSINNPVLSRQLGLNETFITDICSISKNECEHLTLQSYHKIETEAVEWQKQYNPVFL